MMRAFKDVVLLILRIRLGPGHQNKIEYMCIYIYIFLYTDLYPLSHMSHTFNEVQTEILLQGKYGDYYLSIGTQTAV